MRKRYSILMREIGSGREIELCQVDSNPRRVAEAAGMKLLRTSSSGRQYRTKRYDWIRIVDNGETSTVPRGAQRLFKTRRNGRAWTMAVRAIRVVITSGRECAPSQAPSAEQLADIVIVNISRLDPRGRMVLATLFARASPHVEQLINIAAAPIPRAAASFVRNHHQHDTFSSSTELQLLLPFVTYCGRFPGICPLTGRSSIADIYCYRCSCIAPGNITVPSSW